MVAALGIDLLINHSLALTRQPPSKIGYHPTTVMGDEFEVRIFVQHATKHQACHGGCGLIGPAEDVKYPVA